MSRDRYPNRKRQDRCPGCLPTAVAAFRAVPQGGRNEPLPTDHRHPRSDNVGATRTLWTVAIAGSLPTRRWYSLPHSAPPRVIAWRRGKLLPVRPPCSIGLIVDRCWGANAAGVAT